MTFATKALVLSVIYRYCTGRNVSAQNLLNGAVCPSPAAPFYQRAFSDLAHSGGLKVNYQSVGSELEVRQFHPLATVICRHR